METRRRVKAAVVGVGLIGEQHAQIYHDPREAIVSW
jgi:hypothetical protein